MRPRVFLRNSAGPIVAVTLTMTCFIAMAGCQDKARDWAGSGNQTSSGENRFAKEPLVDLKSVDPRIVVDLRYATSENFLGKVLYADTRCFVRRQVANQLRAVQSELMQRGIGLIVLDGYRPLHVQREMWRLVPNPDYVADPEKGSRHNRGAAVDVALADLHGNPLRMPTQFDDFSPAAHRDAFVDDPIARTNREILTRVMQSHGFIGLPSEWWHFDIENWHDYPIIPEDEPVGS